MHVQRLGLSVLCSFYTGTNYFFFMSESTFAATVAVAAAAENKIAKNIFDQSLLCKCTSE